MEASTVDHLSIILVTLARKFQDTKKLLFHVSSLVLQDESIHVQGNVKERKCSMKYDLGRLMKV